MHVCYRCVRLRFSVLIQEIGWEECLRDDLLCVRWNVKPELSQLIRGAWIVSDFFGPRGVIITLLLLLVFLSGTQRKHKRSHRMSRKHRAVTASSSSAIAGSHNTWPRSTRLVTKTCRAVMIKFAFKCRPSLLHIVIHFPLSAVVQLVTGLCLHREHL